MKTILELASDIQREPENLKHLLDSFRTTDESLRMFLFSLKEVSPVMVPALLRTFHMEQDRANCKTFLDIIRGESVGVVFEEKSSGINYVWSGFNKDNEPTVVKFGTNTQIQLDPSTVIIRWF
jgi:hypothetical protein